MVTDLYGVTSESRFLQICSPSFDPSVLEWLAAFSFGATLVVVPSTIIGGPDLAELLRTERVTHTIITCSAGDDGVRRCRQLRGPVGRW